MDEGVILANLNEVRTRVGRRCQINGIERSSVTILGVTKSVSAEMASLAVKAGLTNLGENKVQEGLEKMPFVKPRPRWHLIGHLQKNKIKRAAEIFDVIESVDSLELAGSISNRAVEGGRRMEVYLQVNSSGEQTKHGFEPGIIFNYADKINEMPGLKLTGLMTLGPLTEDEDRIRGSFELAKSVYDKLQSILGSEFRILSMGMSGDYEIALDYGANELRIGTAIFGRRPTAR